MSGLYDGTSGLWGGSSGLTDGVSGLWSGASGLIAGGGAPPPPPLNPDALAYIAAMTTQPTEARKALISTLFDSLQASGVYAKLDWLSLLASHNAQAARLNAVNPAQTLTSVISVNFTTDLGMSGNGTSGYLSSPSNPGLGGMKYVQDSAHMGMWLNVNVTSFSMWEVGLSNYAGLFGFASGTTRAWANSATFMQGNVSPQTSAGHTVWTRRSAGPAAACELYRNAVSLVIQDNTSAPIPNAQIIVGATNSSTTGTITPANYSSRRIAAVHWGSKLTTADVTALYSALNTYLTALGAQFLAFDQSFNAAPTLTYNDDDLLVERTSPGGLLAVRGATQHSTGKWYAELEVVGRRLRFAGVVDSTFTTNGAGGGAGTNRVGVEVNNLVSYPGVSSPFGFVDPTDIVRIAYDADAKRVWIKVENGDWNDNPLADPSTDTGGLWSAGLVGGGYVGVTLRPQVGAGVRIRTVRDVGYTVPAGFTEWTS